jgi:hypothetical protein
MYWHKELSRGSKNKCDKEIDYLQLLNVHKTLGAMMPTHSPENSLRMTNTHQD